MRFSLSVAIHRRRLMKCSCWWNVAKFGNESVLFASYYTCKCWPTVRSKDGDLLRYGLSITFFIIIGDQLDRCMWVKSTSRDHLSGRSSSNLCGRTAVLSPLVLQSTIHHSDHFVVFHFTPMLFQNNQISPNPKVRPQTLIVESETFTRFWSPYLACSVWWPLSTSLSLCRLNTLSSILLMWSWKQGTEEHSFLDPVYETVYVDAFSPESWMDIFLVLPTMCFCYQVRSCSWGFVVSHRWTAV